MKRSNFPGWSFILFVLTWQLALPSRQSAGGEVDRVIVESAREIPVAFKADVAIVGGSTWAVSAAVAAAEEGARVFLAAPRPYLGEDLCATLRQIVDLNKLDRRPIGWSR